MGLKRLVLKKVSSHINLIVSLIEKTSSTTLNRPLFLKKKRKLDVENAVSEYSLSKSKVL